MSIILTMILLLGFGGTATVSRVELERVVEQYIRERLASGSVETSVEFRSVPNSLVVRASEYSLQVSANAPVLSGNVSLPVEIITNGHVEQQCLVSVKVRTFDSVLVATKQLGQHQAITLDDVRRERIETTSLRSNPLKSAEELVGLRTSRIVSTGSVLTNDLVQTVPVVTRGSSVRLIVRGKNVQFSVDAVAKEDGLKGDLVTVQRVGNGSRLEATVLDQNTVEMMIH